MQVQGGVGKEQFGRGLKEGIVGEELERWIGDEGFRRRISEERMGRGDFE